MLKVQRISMYFKSSFGALEEAGGSCLGFAIMIMFWIWSLVFDITMVQILALYLDVEDAENIHALFHHLGLWRTLEIPDWGLSSSSQFGYVHWYLVHPCSKFCLFTLILNVQKHPCP